MPRCRPKPKVACSPARTNSENAVNTRPRKAKALSWLPRRIVLTALPAHPKRLYLTFDDGPDPLVTPLLADLLATHSAKATFFVVGREAEKHPDLVARLVADGHRIGNHSYSHARFDAIAQSVQDEEVARTDRILAAHDGRATHLFRPPYGALPASLLLHSALRGRQIAYWSVDSLDYQDKSACDLVDGLRREPPRSGDIVLMHDRARTVEMLRTMIPEWIAAGFALEALPAAA